MTTLVHYPTKAALKAAIGQPLRYSETSAFGAEYQSNGWLTVVGRPHLDRSIKREYFARVLMAGGLITKVE